MNSPNWLLNFVLFNCVFKLSYHPSDAFFSNVLKTITSPFSEVCDSTWVSQDLPGLENALDGYVFGQHIAVETVIVALQSHLKKEHRQKPLVFSFHGWPGGGKGFVGNFILKYFFKNGEGSQFVKKYSARLSFPLDSHVYAYQRQLQKDIEDTISICPRAIFLFDEVDKYPSKVLDGIKAYLDFSSNVNGHDFREAIFIFITNNGQREITDITIDKYKNGYKREDLDLKDYEYILKTTAFNDEGGFYRSDLIKHHLIDYVVPFLPLEKRHVQRCILAEMYRHGVEDDYDFFSFANEITEEMSFGPADFPYFSTNGCKNIAEKVAFKIEKALRRQRRSEF